MEIMIAAVVSLIVEGIKRYFSTNTFETLLALLVVSFAAAAGMMFLQAQGLWDTLVRLMLFAAGVYALLVQRLPKFGS